MSKKLDVEGEFRWLPRLLIVDSGRRTRGGLKPKFIELNDNLKRPSSEESARGSNLKPSTPRKRYELREYTDGPTFTIYSIEDGSEWSLPAGTTEVFVLLDLLNKSDFPADVEEKIAPDGEGKIYGVRVRNPVGDILSRSLLETTDAKVAHKIANVLTQQYEERKRKLE